MNTSRQPAVLPRLATQRVQRALDALPVVVVMGARQTGKSTLVRTLPGTPARPYFTLDDLDVRADATESPDALVRRAPNLILDEVQREPDILLAIKRAVDERRPRQPGQFLLTGSANLLLMHHVSDTLAGRATYVTLQPLTRREQLGQGRAGLWSELLETPVERWYDLVLDQDGERAGWQAVVRRGGYPTPAHEMDSPTSREEWFRGYVRTYLERDLQDLSAIDRLVDFRRLMRAACLRLGGLLNQAELGRDTGIPGATLHRYLNLLEISFQLVRLEPYSVNRTKRLVRSPKLYWTDSALALHIAGEAQPRGAHLENLILADLLAWREVAPADPQILFWRAHTGEEVDFVVEAGGRLLAIEVKASSRVRHDDARHLLTFRRQYGDAVHGAMILYTGDEVVRIAEGVLAAPWWRVL